MSGDDKPPFSFDGQRADEDILWVKHQHPWVLSKTGLLAVAIIGLGALPLLLPGGGQGLKLLMWAAIVAAILIVARLFMWWNTVYILTTERMIGVSQPRILTRKMDEVPLENIQNVTHIKKGIGPMLFDYGDVQLQTSGSRVAMEIDRVENPLVAQQNILDAARKNTRVTS